MFFGSVAIDAVLLQDGQYLLGEVDRLSERGRLRTSLAGCAQPAGQSRQHYQAESKRHHVGG